MMRIGSVITRSIMRRPPVALARRPPSLPPALPETVRRSLPASRVRRLHTLETVLSEGQGILDRFDARGDTALHSLFRYYPPHPAKRREFVHILEGLLNKGADPNKVNACGITVLHRLVEHQFEQGKECDFLYRVIRILLDHGARDDIPDGAGKTAAQLVATQELGYLLASYGITTS